MKKIKIDELVKVWQEVEFEFNDDVDLSSKEKIMNAIENCEYCGWSTKDTYYDTEEHLEWDENTIKELKNEVE